MLRELDDLTEHLSTPAYVVATVLMVLPLGDLAMALFPPHLGTMTWRFGAIGALSGGFTLPVVGFGIALANAVARRHVGTLLLLAILAGLLALGLFAALPMLLLDTLQMRGQVRPEAQAQFLRAGAYGAVRLLVLGSASVVFCRAALRARREERKYPTTRRGAVPVPAPADGPA